MNTDHQTKIEDWKRGEITQYFVATLKRRSEIYTAALLDNLKTSERADDWYKGYVSAVTDIIEAIGELDATD